ncbi:cyclin-like F-box protein [Senna tora]|uniref:Cyclin-like F-box protein n=1 Tax=Senna tora TaxID=362788 RepID=A0A834TNF4_9FABA|nr:cyclin-like F-box protein [Senna tora]
MTMAIKRKRNSELNEAKTDRISDLPDCILSHILSFLPTKVAISTSVLSKRWKPLPLSLTTIDLDDTSFCFRDQPQFSFVTFVYRIFLLRPLDVPVKTFRLKCETSYGHDVDAWIRGAIQRKAERLDITVPATVSGLGLWSVVFNCEWLVELRLMSVFEMIRGISSPVNLPSLKILRLEGVRFSDYKCFFNVLAGCTNLQHLVLKDLAFFYANHNSESYLSFMMNLEKLKIFHYPHPIPTFNNLVHMELNILNYNWDLITKMLQNSPKLESLVILKGTPCLNTTCVFHIKDLNSETLLKVKSGWDRGLESKGRKWKKNV